MKKRFCDACHGEISPSDKWLDIGATLYRDRQTGSNNRDVLGDGRFDLCLACAKGLPRCFADLAERGVF